MDWTTEQPAGVPDSPTSWARLRPLDDIEVVFDDEPPVSAAGHLLAPGAPARAHGSRLRWQLVAGDTVSLAATWVLFDLLRRHADARDFMSATIAILVTLVGLYQAGLYRTSVSAMRSLEAVRVAASCGLGALAFLAAEALAGAPKVTTALEAGAVATSTALVLRWRFARWLRAQRSSSQFMRTVVLVGTNDDAVGLWSLLSEEPELGFRVGAVTGPPSPGAPWADLPSSPEAWRAPELARRSGASGVMIVASAFDVSTRARVVELCLAAGLHVQLWPGLQGLSSRRVRMAPVSGVPMLYIEPRRASRAAMAVKRGLDVVITLVLAAPAAAVVALGALAIKIDDRGPVLYRSLRAGRGGRPILVLKLRTMVPGAASMKEMVETLNERKGGPLFKSSSDPRVTRVGSFLRATSIDELPQLWNVLVGTMSLVGPRPALLDEVSHFDTDLCRRHDMRPGITGLWQVEARDNPSFSAYRRLDLSYVDDWSLALDLAILLTTAHEVATRAWRGLVAGWHDRRRQPGPCAVAVPRPGHGQGVGDTR